MSATQTNQNGDKKMTAMILKNIPRNEIDNTNGFVAETFDRVTVTRIQERSAAVGGNIAHCVNDNGERFYAFLACGEASID